MAKEKNKRKREPLIPERAKIVIYFLILVLALILFPILLQHNSQDNTGQSNTEETVDERETERPENTPWVPSSPIPAESPDIVYEDTSKMESKELTVAYINKEITANIGYGMTLKLGIDDSSKTDAIYLNPVFTYDYAANPNEQYGIIFMTSRIPVEFSQKNSVTPDRLNEERILAISGRTFDQCVSAAYYTERNYGARWKNDDLLDGLTGTGTTIYMRIVRLIDGYLMGVARAEIGYDDMQQRYEILELENDNILAVGGLDSEICDDALLKAVEYIKAGNSRYKVSLPGGYLGTDGSVLEKLPRPYYNKFLDTDGEITPAGVVSKCDIYAVSIPFNGFCYFTVYLAPEPQAHGMSQATYGDEPLNLVVIGSDAYNPINREEMEAMLLPEDIDRLLPKV